MAQSLERCILVGDASSADVGYDSDLDGSSKDSRILHRRNVREHIPFDAPQHVMRSANDNVYGVAAGGLRHT